MCRQGNDRSLLEISLPQLYGKKISLATTALIWLRQIVAFAHNYQRKKIADTKNCSGVIGTAKIIPTL